MAYKNCGLKKLKNKTKQTNKKTHLQPHSMTFSEVADLLFSQPDQMYNKNTMFLYDY